MNGILILLAPITFALSALSQVNALKKRGEKLKGRN